MAKPKNEYINKKEMLQHLVDLRILGDYDREVFMLKKKTFKGLKYDENGDPIPETIPEDMKEIAKDLMAKDAEYKARCFLRLENETDTETTARRQLVDKIKNKVGKMFIDICEGTMRKPNFTNYSADRKGDMISDALWAMTRYMNRYNLDKPNPYAYFTTVCHNAYKHRINEHKKQAKKYKSLSFIENMDGEESFGDFDD